MITLLEARKRARSRLRAHLGSWAVDADIGRPSDASAASAPLLTIPLKPPNEREMLADEATAEGWARAWATAALPVGASVEWEERAWRSIGRQRVPVRLRLADARAVAAFAGGEPERSFTTLSDRARALCVRLGDTTDLRRVLRRHAARLLDYDEPRFAQVVEVATWLTAHPVTGMRPRQLPIRGVDTKWFAAHRSLLSDLHAAVTGTSELGIVDADPLIRLRVLDAELAPGGVVDFAAPAAELARLTLDPDLVLLVENRETLLALPSLSGTIAIHGGGYAVDVVARLPWVLSARVLYWGDLDSNGFAILHRVRSTHPDTSSVLMDEETLMSHRDLWVSEPRPARGRFGTLTEAEMQTLERLRAEGDVRLEQERIPWTTALGALRERVG